MDKATKRYREAQLGVVMVNDLPYKRRIQISSTVGSTFHLDITEAEFIKIKAILCGEDK